ncbi:MAG: portal protein [Candidatus Poseidoniaceae archaeon]
MELKKLTEDDIKSIAADAVDNAEDFINSEIVEDRLKAQRYYDGQVDIGEEEGRSRVVSTKIRDKIRAIKPSLMRVFLSTDKPVEFAPMGPEDSQFAEQATKYVNYKFNTLGGYQVLSDVFSDSLLKKCGVVKCYWNTEKKSETYDHQDLPPEEFSLIVNDPRVEVIEHSENIEIEIDEMGMEIERITHDVKVSLTEEYGDLVIESLPPEEFFISAEATSLEDAYAVVHKREVRVGDLVAMGYDFDVVSELTGHDTDNFQDEEKFERQNFSFDDDEQVLDPSMRMVIVSEVYMKIDVDGTGVPSMHKILLAGGSDELLDYEPWGDVPFAVFQHDPEPHSWVGNSLADILFSEQDAATAMLRGVLDNVALTNNPRTELVEGMVNTDDFLNNEIGGVVRVKAGGSVTPLTVPFVAGQTLSAVEYFDAQIDHKTGVSAASSGLDPNALQNTTATAVNATVQGAASQIEVMARNLAEGGVTQLFKLMLKLTIENCDKIEMMAIAGNDYMPVDPRSWNKEMDVTCNVGLGTGREGERLAALQQALDMQVQIFTNYGVGNGLVGMTEIRNTLADMLALGGLRNIDRYFRPMDQQQEMMLQEQAQQQQGEQPMDQATAYLQAEQLKAQAKSQTDMAKLQIDAQKAIAQDDRERDQMDQDLLVKAAEILGKYQTNVDVAGVKQAQALPRYPQDTPVQAVTGGRF